MLETLLVIESNALCKNIELMHDLIHCVSLFEVYWLRYVLYCFYIFFKLENFDITIQILSKFIFESRPDEKQPKYFKICLPY